MSKLLELAEMEHEDEEFVPEIVSSKARLSIKGPVKKISDLFARAAAVAPSKEVIPGTKYTRLEAIQETSSTAAHVRVTASDGEQTVSIIADGITVLMDGVVAVPAKRIHDVLKLVHVQIASIEVIGTEAWIRAGKALWRIQIPNDDVYIASLLDVQEASVRTMEVDPFLRSLAVARAAASTTEARSSLMQVQIRNGSITGCDGGRLHRAVVPNMDPTMLTTIPVRVVDEILKTLADHREEMMSFGYTEQHLVFHIGEDRIVAQRLLVPFPEVDNLLLAPALTNNRRIVVDRKQLLASILRVRVNADPDSAVISLSLAHVGRTESNEIIWVLVVRAKDRDGNSGQEVVECQWSGTKSPLELRFNHHYLSDLLSIFQTEHVSLLIGEDTKTMKSPLLVEDTERGISGIVQQVTSSWD